MKLKQVEKKDKVEVITLDGKKYEKKKFLVEENHPAIGRILIIGDRKFKVMDEASICKVTNSGTFIAPFTEEDQEKMDEYDEDLERLSEKLAQKVDVKRLIKENIKNRPLQEIKTGLFILKAQEEGEDIEEEHHKGCYHYKIHYKDLSFDFMTGFDVDERSII